MQLPRKTLYIAAICLGALLILTYVSQLIAIN